VPEKAWKKENRNKRLNFFAVYLLLKLRPLFAAHDLRDSEVDRCEPGIFFN